MRLCRISTPSPAARRAGPHRIAHPGRRQPASGAPVCRLEPRGLPSPGAFLGLDPPPVGPEYTLPHCVPEPGWPEARRARYYTVFKSPVYALGLVALG